MSDPNSPESTKKSTPAGPSAPQAGFTLIEILIAVLLLSLMLVLASVALRNLALSWQRFSTPYPQKAMAFYRLQAAVQSIFPYVVTRSSLGARSREAEKHFFFQGENDECTFITLSPAAVTAPAIARIYLDDGRVMLAEAELYSADADYLHPGPPVDSEPLVLYEDAEKLSFSYTYKMTGQEDEVYMFPHQITMTVDHNGGSSIRHLFTVKSNYLEKIRIMLLLDQNT